MLVCQYLFHIETSQLICHGNQLTGFYMRETLVIKGLRMFLNATAVLNLDTATRGVL